MGRDLLSSLAQRLGMHDVGAAFPGQALGVGEVLLLVHVMNDPPVRLKVVQPKVWAADGSVQLLGQPLGVGSALELDQLLGSALGAV